MNTIIAWIRKERLSGLVMALITVCTVWVLLEVCDGLIEGTERDLDRWLVLAVRRAPDAPEPIGPQWLRSAARDVTSLGGYAVLTLVTAAVAVFFGLTRKPLAGWVLIGATLGGWAMMKFLKWLFQRERPMTIPGIADGESQSFPSGHAMLSAIVYLTVGSILSCFLTEKRQQAYVLSVALTVTLLVGVSRVYLGVHYPTDVLAGWSLGLAWGIVCTILTHRFARREPIS